MAKPEFVRISACTTEEQLDLQFREAGLGPDQTVTVYGCAKVVAEWERRNPAGHHGLPANKAIIQAQVAVSIDVTCDQARQVTGRVRLSPPRPTPEELTLGGGHELVLLRVVYTDIQLLDGTNYVVADLPGFFEIPTIAFGKAALPGNSAPGEPGTPPENWSSPRYP